jgi:hypothetical protein
VRARRARNFVAHYHYSQELPKEGLKPSALALYGTAAVFAAVLRLAVPILRTMLPNAARSCAERSAPGCCFRPYHFLFALHVGVLVLGCVYTSHV